MPIAVSLSKSPNGPSKDTIGVVRFGGFGAGADFIDFGVVDKLY